MKEIPHSFHGPFLVAPRSAKQRPPQGALKSLSHGTTPSQETLGTETIRTSSVVVFDLAWLPSTRLVPAQALSFHHILEEREGRSESSLPLTLAPETQ